MSLQSGMVALFPQFLISGAIQLRDNGEGPYIAFWDEQVIGISQAEGEARALAFDDLILTQTTPYRVECTHAAIEGKTVTSQLWRDGKLLATGTATVEGQTAYELFIVPSGNYTVRFIINDPYMAGEVGATFA